MAECHQKSPCCNETFLKLSLFFNSKALCMQNLPDQQIIWERTQGTFLVLTAALRRCSPLQNSPQQTSVFAAILIIESTRKPAKVTKPWLREALLCKRYEVVIQNYDLSRNISWCALKGPFFCSHKFPNLYINSQRTDLVNSLGAMF